VNICRFLLPGEEPVCSSEKREYGGEPLWFCTVKGPNGNLYGLKKYERREMGLINPYFF